MLCVLLCCSLVVSLVADIQHVTYKSKVKLSPGHKNLLDNVYYFRVPESSNADQIADKLSKDANVQWSEVLDPIVQHKRLDWAHRGVGTFGDWLKGPRKENSFSPFNINLGIDEAWALGYKGAGVTVRVVDDALEWRHPMIGAAYAPNLSTDMLDLDNDPSPRYIFDDKLEYIDDHGTKCSSTIVGQENSTCTAGSAPRATLSFCRVLNAKETSLDIAHCMMFKTRHVKIETHSFGPTDDGKSFQRNTNTYREVIKHVSTRGNHGKGAILVWASGNGGYHLDDCNADYFQRSPHTISISGIDVNGKPCGFTEHCAPVFGVVGGHNIMTSNIYGDCYGHYGGTSAASPLATGILSLVLEASPTLSQRDVMHIIVRGATWEPLLFNEGWVVNGGGRIFHHKLGFGILRAPKLIHVARRWAHVDPQETCKLGPQLTNFNIQTASSRSVTFTINNEKCRVWFLEDARFSFPKVVAASRGDFSVKIISPSGTPSLLYSNRPEDKYTKSTNFMDLQTNAFWGENPSGTWTITLENSGENGGIIVPMVMGRLHGTYKNPDPTEYTSYTRYHCNDICQVKHYLAQSRCAQCKVNLKEAIKHLKSKG